MEDPAFDIMTYDNPLYDAAGTLDIILSVQTVVNKSMVKLTKA